MNWRVMLVDDHPLFIEGLQYLLETYGVSVVGLACNGREAVVKAGVLKPDLILMDIKMPDLCGLDALKQIKAEMPDTKVVMLTTSEDDEDLLSAIKLGASGYLLKNTSANELVTMLHELEKGIEPSVKWVTPKVISEFKGRVETPDNGQNNDMTEQPQLTQRQVEILEMVSRGMTYKEAGDALGLSERTVKYHMGRILEILRLENRAQVIAYAARMGLIDI